MSDVETGDEVETEEEELVSEEGTPWSELQGMCWYNEIREATMIPHRNHYRVIEWTGQVHEEPFRDVATLWVAFRHFCGPDLQFNRLGELMLVSDRNGRQHGLPPNIHFMSLQPRLYGHVISLRRVDMVWE